MRAVIKIGEFSIYRQDDNSLWIEHDSGEGGQFSNELFLAAISKFYSDNF